MENLLLELKKNKITIHLDNGTLRLNIPNNFDAKEILEEIKKNKNELIKFIENSTSFNAAYKVIEKAPDKEYYTLSSAQKRQYFLYEFDRTSLSYNIPQVVCLEGDLDISLLKSVFNTLVIRHESLRTIFEVVNEQPVQKIVSDQEIDIEIFKTTESEVSLTIQNFIRPFDLSKPPLIRIGVIHLTERKHILMVDMHHIITDGVSNEILVKEFMTLYKGENLSPLSLQYKDYAVWQQKNSQQLEISEQKNFWLHMYTEDVQPINLPTDFKRPHVKGYKGATIGFSIENEQARKLKSINEHLGSTDFMMFLSIYYILLYKLTNQEDIVIGTPVAGREHKDLKDMIGMFVNTLPLRNRLKGEYTFREFLLEVKTNTLACIHNQSYQYETLIDELKVERDTSRNPLFDTLFSYQNFIEADFEIPGLKLSTYKRESRISKFDISLTATEKNNQFYFSMAYSVNLFTEQSIDRFISYFKRIVTAVTENIDIKIADINILSNKEKHQLLNDFNATSVAFPVYNSVLEMFEIQVSKTPDNTAIIYEDTILTYNELDKNVSQVGSYLLTKKNIQLEERVGIMLEREAFLIPTIYGILKAGAAYVPIDPSLPSARIKAILKDAGIRVLITRGDYLSDELLNDYTEIVDLDKEKSEIVETVILEDYPKITPDNLAYVIYTSGSTGTPKGVMIEHQSLMNTIQSMDACYPLQEKDVYMFKTTHSFDVSVAELFGWFHAGGKLSILPSGATGNTDKILEEIQRNHVTHIGFVPSLFSIFLEEVKRQGIDRVKSLKYILLGGEALSSNLIKDFNSLNTSIILENIYGPTEATIYSSRYATQDWQGQSRVPIGKPLSNTKLYIMDSSVNLLPIGVVGELCIGGIGVARGYMNNDDLTQSKFITVDHLSDERIYKTGDLTRWLPDGNIEYLGRIDDQVKIRGFRIELEEIANSLMRNDWIDKSIVVVKEKDSDKFIVAYYTSETPLITTDLKKFLSDLLPDYMLPSFYVHLDDMPLNSSGKIDKKSLPDPELKKNHDYVGPSNEIERQMTKIWSEILVISEENISVDDRFFEIGGHSLKAIVLVNRIAKEFDVEITLREIFEKSQINSLSDYIITVNQIEIENKDNIIELSI